MSLLNLSNFDRAQLQHDPCDFLVVPEFVKPAVLADLLRDYPKIDKPGSLSADEVDCGPAFSKLLEELKSPELAAHFSRKFDTELGSLPLQIGIRRYADHSDGNIHNDSRSKFVTALIYFNEEWTDQAGRLRLLRGPDDIDDYAAEVVPAHGTLFAFRRSENSYHGFHPCEGERRSLQMYWVNPTRGRRGGPKKTPEFFRKFKRLFKTG